MSLGFSASLAPPLPSFSSTVQSANSQPSLKTPDGRPQMADGQVPLQAPFPPYSHPILFGNHLGENLPHSSIPNPNNFPMNNDNPLMNTMENWENWRQFQQAAWAHNLDPHMLAFYHNAGYSMDFANGPRRKNATRETTSMLKAWLNEHKKNPYPTKGEKIMLAIITKMSLTQVSTWFANARRRLKKENKMTWSPRNRADDDREPQAPSSTHSGHGSDEEDEANSSAIGAVGGDHPIDIDDVSNDEEEAAEEDGKEEGKDTRSCAGSPCEVSKPTKPKIWSLVDLARKDSRSDDAGDTTPPCLLSPPNLPPGHPGLHGPPLPPGHPCMPPGPPQGFHGAPIFPPNSAIFPPPVSPGNKSFLPPPPPVSAAAAAAAAAAYIHANPFLYPHYPSIGLHPFSAFSRPNFSPLEAREPPKLTPEIPFCSDKELDRPDSSQFHASKP